MRVQVRVVSKDQVLVPWQEVQAASLTEAARVLAAREVYAQLFRQGTLRIQARRVGDDGPGRVFVVERQTHFEAVPCN